MQYALRNTPVVKKERSMKIKLPEHILNLPPYTPIEPFDVLSERIGRAPEEIVKLDANENPYGMSPRAQAALAQLPFGHISQQSCPCQNAHSQQGTCTAFL